MARYPSDRAQSVGLHKLSIAQTAYHDVDVFGAPTLSCREPPRVVSNNSQSFVREVFTQNLRTTIFSACNMDADLETERRLTTGICFHR